MLPLPPLNVQSPRSLRCKRLVAEYVRDRGGNNTVVFDVLAQATSDAQKGANFLNIGGAGCFGDLDYRR